MQTDATHIKAARFFWIVLFVYAALGLINLDLIPIPWLDEAACLEPAVLWQRTGHLVSKAWPTPGTEDIFLSYPPGIVFLHKVTLSVFPAEVFWVRLPFLILHCSALLLLYQTLKKTGLDIRWVMLLVLYFLFDKVVFEISRSGRSEVIEVFFLSLWFFIQYHLNNKNGYKFLLLGLCSGVLLLTHLKEWPVVAVLFIWVSMEQRSVKTMCMNLVGLLILPVLYMWFIDFRIGELYRQLFTHSMEHSAGTDILHNIYNYFIGRFYPVYKEQPWFPLLHLFITWVSLRQLKTNWRRNLPAAVWIFAGLVWMFMLGPYYRYFLPMYVIGMFIAATLLIEKKIAFPNLRKWYWLPIAFMMLWPFISRHLLAFVQRPERDPEKALVYLEKQVPKRGKILLYGNEIGLYYAAKHANVDFTHVTSPDHFQFNEYDSIFYLTDMKLGELQLRSSYKPEQYSLPPWAYRLGKGGTFANMNMYFISNEAEWKKVAKPFYGWN